MKNKKILLIPFMYFVYMEFLYSQSNISIPNTKDFSGFNISTKNIYDKTESPKVNDSNIIGIDVSVCDNKKQTVVSDTINKNYKEINHNNQSSIMENKKFITPKE